MRPAMSTLDAVSDYAREAAREAVAAHLATHLTNTIGTSQVDAAVTIALDAFEDELYRQMNVGEGWVVMLGLQPMIVLPTKRLAKHELRLLRRAADGEGAWRVARTQRTHLED